MSDVSRVRARRDFFTNPTFAVLMRALHEMREKEMVGLRSAGRGESITEVNYHAGIVEGIERVIERIENERKDRDDNESSAE